MDLTNAAPTTLGKYEIRGTLGRGAMGTVYDGWDPVIGRRVAIKTVRLLDHADPEAQEGLERFKREAQAAGRLTHPNIVGVYDYGETDETAYIVMEFVEGQSLKQRLDARERFPVAETVRIMEQMLAGLQFSHDSGVIHRDIKPGNVMLAKGGRVKLADFGIARIESSVMTQDGTMLGTPAFMSPEQLMALAVDARTDLYSAGVVLYQMLTGERPFEGGLTAIIHKALNTTPPRPSEIAVTAPPAFDAVVSRAMARRPADRYPDADSFARALRAALEGPAQVAPLHGLDAEDAEATIVSRPAPMPAPAPPPAPVEAAMPKPAPAPPPAPSAKPAGGGSNMVVIGGVAAVVLLGIGGGAWFAMQPSPPKAPPPPTLTAQVQPVEPPHTSPPATPSVVAPPPAVPAPVIQQAAPAPAPVVQQAPKPVEAPSAPPQPAPTPAPVVQQAAKPAEPPPASPQPAPTPAPVVQQAAKPAEAAPQPASPPANSAPAAPVAVSEPPPQPNQLAANAPLSPATIREALASLQLSAACAIPRFAISDDGGVSAYGIVGMGTPTLSLHEAVRQVVGSAQLSWLMRPIDGPYCDAFNVIRPLAQPSSPAFGLTLKDDVTRLKDRDLIRPILKLPDFAAYLQVDYLSHDGSVTHLFPATGAKSKAFASNTTLPLGDSKQGVGAVGPPYGTDVIIAIASSVPLFAQGLSQDMETADNYMPALRAAIDAARRANAKLTGRALVLETVVR
jgi:predicted Ser/Thr protein kinase